MVEKWLVTFFRILGTKAATYPILVIIISIVAVGCMCIGIVKLNVTIDPVALWASPTSKSRQEKLYFDEHFQPFYRIEQVIIRPVAIRSFIDNFQDYDEQFGPVFNLTFIRSVLDLKDKIMKIGQNTNYSLEKICLTPLKSNDDVKTVGDCLIQSIWETGETDDLFYLNKYKGCIQYEIYKSYHFKFKKFIKQLNFKFRSCQRNDIKITNCY